MGAKTDITDDRSAVEPSRRAQNTGKHTRIPTPGKHTRIPTPDSFLRLPRHGCSTHVTLDPAIPYVQGQGRQPCAARR